MSLGFVMLVHKALDRASQVARHVAVSGCPVVIHVDAQVPDKDFLQLKDSLSDLHHVRFSARRHRCERGTWGIVAASIDATSQILEDFPQISHVFLVSGSCLLLRPIPDLLAYLANRPRTDFIESVTVEDARWTRDVPDRERLSLRFPFSARRHRFLFDRFVALQRRVGVERRVPDGLVPYLGSQWWCLTRKTLEAILEDDRRGVFERFFRHVWMPAECYFQSVVRLHSQRIESRSLTLSKFGHQGKPHTFYDDHLQLLRRSDFFVARKIWPRAERLYSSFLSNDPAVTRSAEPSPGKIDRLFARAAETRVRGRAGLYMQSRFPPHDHENGRSAGPYSVFEGFGDLFENFEMWLARATGSRVHGHLFAPERAEFAGGEPVCNGCLSDSARLRDYNPSGFLTNLVWNTRGERQCFMFGPADNQSPAGFMAGDPNAQISVITGAWAIRLYRTNVTLENVRKEAARLQRIELEHVELLRARWAKARIRIWTLAEFIEAPMDNLQEILDEIGNRGPRRLTEVPKFADLSGFGRFLQDLKNDGMNLHVAGDFPIGHVPAPLKPQVRPYLVK